MKNRTTLEVMKLIIAGGTGAGVNVIRFEVDKSFHQKQSETHTKITFSNEDEKKTYEKVTETAKQVVKEMGSEKNVTVSVTHDGYMPNAGVSSSLFSNDAEISIVRPDLFNDKSLRAVLGHESAHAILEHNIKIAAVDGFTIGVLLRQLHHLSHIPSSPGNGSIIAGATALFFFSVPALHMTQLAFRRQCEMEADTLAARQLNNAEDAIDTLKTVHALHLHENEEKSSWTGSLFRTHPFCDDRVKNLEEISKQQKSNRP